MRLLRGELLKLVKRPATRITLILQLAIILLIYISVAASYRTISTATTPDVEQSRAGIRLLLTFPGAYDAIVGLITGLGGLLAIGYGASAAGADWGWGMVKVAVARGESRSRYILAKLLAVILLVGVGVVIAFLAGVVAALVAALIAGIDTSGVGDATALGHLPEQLLRGFWGMAEQAAIGFAIATFARSQLAGLGAGIALYFVEQFATLFLRDVVKYMPFHVASSALRISTGTVDPPGASGALDPTLSLLLVTVYLVVAAVVAAVIVERAEVTG